MSIATRIEKITTWLDSAKDSSLLREMLTRAQDSGSWSSHFGGSTNNVWPTIMKPDRIPYQPQYGNDIWSAQGSKATLEMMYNPDESPRNWLEWQEGVRGMEEVLKDMKARLYNQTWDGTAMGMDTTSEPLFQVTRPGSSQWFRRMETVKWSQPLPSSGANTNKSLTTGKRGGGV